MGALQACLLVAVTIATPSRFLIACLLWQAPLIELNESSIPASTGDLSPVKTSPQTRDH
jgi:hypothetical protein